jgi:integrase
MTKEIERLSALAVSRASKPGLYPDGAGLYLRVGRGGSKAWVFRFMLNGKAREMGFGSLKKVSLAAARKKAIDARLMLSEGQDPLAHRREKEERRTAAERLAAASLVTFEDCADAYVRAHEAGWRNKKHRQQWRNTLATYVSPVFGQIPVQHIDVAVVMKVLEPIWNRKTETASRVRGRIEVILDWARVRGYRSGENPARWRGHLDHLLPARSKLRKVKHHAALPYMEIGTFMKELREMDGFGAAALEFLILTAARTGEVIGAQHSEIDLGARVWVVAAERMKGDREHRVPLSSAAIAVLERVQGASENYLFPGRDGKTPLSDMALLTVLARMNRGNITAHGFRSTFRDWAAECTNFPNEVVEIALAHAVANKTEGAYRRGDLLEKRRKLMDAWAAFCVRPRSSNSVIPLQSA